MSSEEDEQKSKLVKQYTLLAIVSAFLLALLWPLDSFFFWIFSGATSYFAFLAFYNRPRVEQEEEKFEYARPAWQQKQQDPSINVSPKNVKLIMVILTITFSGFLLILMIIGFATGDDNPTPVSEENTINQSRELLSEDPNNLDALTNLGNSFYASGQYDSAMVYYERVLKIDSKNSSGLYNKGLVLYQKKEYQKSMDVLRQCISLYPDNTDAIMVLGDNYYSQDQFIQALEWYKQAYDKGARTAALLNVMAYIYDLQNQKGEAIRYYKEALRQDSSLVDVYTRLADLEPKDAEWYKKKARAWQ